MENSFINYFDKNTEIYKGMKKIDDELGGTTPLDVVIKFPVKKSTKDEDDDEFSEWEEEDKKMRMIKQPTGLREIKSIKY